MFNDFGDNNVPTCYNFCEILINVTKKGCLELSTDVVRDVLEKFYSSFILSMLLKLLVLKRNLL